MILPASRQFWKIELPVAVMVAMGGVVWWFGARGILILLFASVLAGPALIWSVASVRCPRCRDRWLWRQATKGKSPSFQPAFQSTACPACGLTAAEMVSGEWRANDGLEATASGGPRI